jgi:hypothetical protein
VFGFIVSIGLYGLIGAIMANNSIAVPTSSLLFVMGNVLLIYTFLLEEK